MPWETRPWTTTPNADVMRMTKTGRLFGKRIRLTLDPRSFETDDANLLRVEGTFLACTTDGPTLLLEERDSFLGGRIPLIDILCIEVLPE